MPTISDWQVFICAILLASEESLALDESDNAPQHVIDPCLDEDQEQDQSQSSDSASQATAWVTPGYLEGYHTHTLAYPYPWIHGLMSHRSMGMVCIICGDGNAVWCCGSGPVLTPTSQLGQIAVGMRWQAWVAAGSATTSTYHF
ncbi:hypothetical protein BJ912DRAFT_930772 [Pholiota molesta]|nr:hypothetical protein BJ912DRAFT_930772 [Pholiota molesta]